jgi:CRP/FNR family transcriptional regulator
VASGKALEHCAVCEIPFDALCRLSEHVSPLQRNVFRVLSQAIVAEQKLATVLSTGDATQRLAAFLLHMATQNQRRGLSTNRMTLPMSRHDIGNFLGMTLETVSRLFSRLAEHGWIRVTRREITLLDPDALEAAANHLRL